LYGSQAMGGVINIITRQPEKQCRTEIESGYGTFDTWSATVRNSATLGKFSYALSGTRLESDGFKEVPKDDRTAKNSASSSIERDNLSGKLRYEFDPSCSLELSGSHHRNQRHGQYNLIQGFRLYENDIDRLDLHFRKQWGGVELQATLFGSDLESGYDHAKAGTYDKVDYASETHGQDWGGAMQVGFALDRRHFLTLGGDFRQADLEKQYNYYTTNRLRKNGGEQDSYSLFVQDEIFLFDEKLIFNLGARYDLWKNSAGYGLDTVTSAAMVDYDDRTDQAFNPKFAARYRLTDRLSLRGGVATAFRTPSLPNLYQGDYSYGVTLYKGNPDLEAEKSVSYELGFDLRPLDSLSLKGTVYQTDIDDSINLITTDSANHIKQYMNIGKVEIQGLEVEADYCFSSVLSFYGTYTLNRSKINDYKENPELEGKDLPWLPKWQAALGLIFNDPKLFALRLNGRYIGKIYDDDLNTKEAGDYFTADLKLSRQFTEYLEGSLTATNLFDRDYQDSQSDQNPGRIIMARFKVSF
ncbi:MAG: TonB-dependent receptor, partial [Deltaproteobacteria bacterium]|nr:TonB-dependent receptor [Deltaproteobacteria bacterium]